MRFPPISFGVEPRILRRGHLIAEGTYRAQIAATRNLTGLQREQMTPTQVQCQVAHANVPRSAKPAEPARRL